MDHRSSSRSEADPRLLGHAATLRPSNGVKQTRHGEPPHADREAGTDGSRDLVAAVYYYEGARELFGAASPPHLGKYTLERVLGCGAFGAVILGHNPDTGGEVAIKILHTDNRRRGHTEGHRFHREAQALARLAHPNIVPVFDAGVADGTPYIVMRRVSGTTLRQAQKGKPWQECVELYLAAARGLSAVHEAGLVHRDFKADNVLVGDDGQVMLADFGLVSIIDESHERDPRGPRDHNSGAFYGDLTRADEVVGTPAYMAPEALEGLSAGPRSDLFSFAASLFEALYGVLPFAGDTPMARYSAATNNEICRRPHGTDVPLWLDATLRKALHADSRNRPATVGELISLLDFRARDRAQAEKRNRRIWIVALALMGTAASVAGTREYVRRSEIAACIAEGTVVTRLWDTEAKKGIRDHYAGMARAQPFIERILPRLDHQALLLKNAWTASCIDARIHQTRDAKTLGRSLWCLDERRNELELLENTLAHGDLMTLQSVATAAAALKPVDECRDEAHLRSRPLPPWDSRREVRSVQQGLFRGTLFEALGAYEAGLAEAQANEARAARLAWPHLLAETRFGVGNMLERLEYSERAESALESAFFTATSSGSLNLAATVADSLAVVTGVSLGRPVDGLRWADMYDAHLALQGHAFRRHSSLSRANILLSGGHHVTAGQQYERALTEIINLTGPYHIDVGSALHNLALAARGGSRRDEIAHANLA